MALSTGIAGLDAMLDGGIPPERTVLLTGGPGTGKSTVGMQFLQAGLAAGETCLYVSTEETPAEIRDSFRGYAFDLDDERLTITTVDAVPGRTVEGTNGELALRVADADGNGTPADGAFAAPFTGEYIRTFIEQYGPADRVVLDSVSGLAAMTEGEHVSRRAVLSLVRLFADEFGATSLFVGEAADDAAGPDAVTANALRYNAHGIVELWRERIRGDAHRFVRVAKMRGVDHDTRVRKLQLTPAGVRLDPERRTRSERFLQLDHRSTGVEGLDELTGGGFIGGSAALIEHDARAEVDPLVMATIGSALRDGASIVLFPSADTTPDRFERMLPADVPPVEELAAADRLFALDFVGTWAGVERNAFNLGAPKRFVERVAKRMRPLYHHRIKRATELIDERRGDQPVYAVIHTESLLQDLDPAQVRQLYYWAKDELLGPEDRVTFVQNPGVMDDQLAEFYAYDAEQILSTWLHESGLQFVELAKSPSGQVGSTRLVTHRDEPPFVAVERVEGGEATAADPGRRRRAGNGESKR